MVMRSSRSYHYSEILAKRGRKRANQIRSLPQDPEARLEWLKTQRPATVPAEWKQNLRKWYGAAADSVKAAEAFQVTEYGRQPSDDEIRRLFPFFPN